jgi:hypothetical protein
MRGAGGDSGPDADAESTSSVRDPYLDTAAVGEGVVREQGNNPRKPVIPSARAPGDSTVPSIAHRLVAKRRASERLKIKTCLLYVAGYLAAGVVLSWCIWQTYLGWY